MSTAPVDVVNRYYRAFNAGDWEAYGALFSTDALLEAPGGVTGSGPAAMQSFDQVWKRAAADFTVTPLAQAAAGSLVASENLGEGTQTGVLATPSGEIPPTGQRVGGKYVGLFEVHDGRITAQRIYFDRLTILEQLGLAGDPAVA